MVPYGPTADGVSEVPGKRAKFTPSDDTSTYARSPKTPPTPAPPVPEAETMLFSNTTKSAPGKLWIACGCSAFVKFNTSEPGGDGSMGGVGLICAAERSPND